MGLSQSGVLGGQVAEVARYQPNPIETRPLTFDLNVTGDLTLYPHRDLSNQVRLVAGGGTLNANTTVDLIGSGFARSGDELKLYFNNFACGLRTLLIKGDGTTFLTYNPTENLNGYVQIVYWDGVWNGYEGALGIT